MAYFTLLEKTLHYSENEVLKERYNKLISIHHRNNFSGGNLPCDLSYLSPEFKKGRQYIVKSDIQRNNVALLVIDDVSKEDISDEKIEVLYSKPVYYIYCGVYGYVLVKLRGKLKRGYLTNFESYSTLDLFKMNVTEVYPVLKISRFGESKIDTFGKHFTLRVKPNLAITAGLDTY